MPKNTLQHFSQDILLDLMVQDMKDLAAIEKNKVNEIAYRAKKKHIQLLQRVIVAKKGWDMPGEY